MAEPDTTMRSSAADGPRNAVGLGDVVHAVAMPVARLIDQVTGSRFEECEGCRRRRARLNALTAKGRRFTGWNW